MIIYLWRFWCLKGIYFERSGISDINGSEGKLTYRGYSIDDLAKNASFEEVSYLIIYGELPNKEELKNFDEKLKYYRSLPNEIYDIFKLTKKGHPMDVLRTCVSSLPSLDKVIKKDSQDQLIENGIKLMSQITIIIAAHQRKRNDMERYNSKRPKPTG